MNQIYNAVINEPWPWWVGGPLIGVFVIVLLVIESKQLGISSSYQYICSKISPLKLDYFKNPSKSAWQFYFVIGLVLGGTAIFYFTPGYQINISAETVDLLAGYGIQEQAGFVPVELFNFSAKSLVVLLAGGFLIGFGARYANGCTAGHAIMGIAQLAPSSIVSTIFFFIGGLVASFFIIPLIF
jgi:uncharacterized membrane protein YedE/YeeE